MIDTTINVGSIITVITVAGTLFFTTGNYATKIDTLKEENEKTVVRVKKNESDITDLKVGVAKIETQLDDRFDRLEEIIMDISD
jgi:septal ring factor EnvC (AmiA/AmiB activator)